MLDRDIAVVIATYNECDNVEALLSRLLELSKNIRVVIVDDNSPDGTGRIVEAVAEANPDRIHLIQRPGKLGYGSALVTGLRRAQELGAEFIVSMDADFSHDPDEIPNLIGALEKSDLALGSRYVDGIRVMNWSPGRLFLSLSANLYVRMILGLRARDCTTGFRAYRQEALRRIDLGRVRSAGYAALVELLEASIAADCTLTEVPIVYEDRQFGRSKMGRGVIVEAAVRPWILLLARYSRRLRVLLGADSR